MKIGVFDSGIGGRLIAKKIRSKLPKTKIIFIADSKHFPYGSKSQAFIFKRSQVLTKKLAKLSATLIVVACNSATTNTIQHLRQQFPSLTFVGIEPPLKPSVTLSKTGKVAIIGTEMTLNSRRYQELIKKFSKNIKLFSLPCPGLASAIEKGRLKTALNIAQKILDKPIADGVDTVGFACTHYPYLLKKMQTNYPNVTFYDPADAVADRVKYLYDSMAKV